MKSRKVGTLLDYSVAATHFTHEERFFFECGFYCKILRNILHLQFFSQIRFLT